MTTRARTVFAGLLVASFCALAAPLPSLGQDVPAAPPAPAWLGVSLQDDPSPNVPSAEDAGAAVPRGVRVQGIVSGSPAHRAGLRARDRIVSINGRTVERVADLIAAIREQPADALVSLGTIRSGRARDITVRLDARPPSADGLKMLDGWIGLESIELPPDLREHFGAPRSSGVMVAEVVDGSPAQSAGIEVGDVIYEVDGEAVGSARILQGLVSSGGIGNRLEVRLRRNGAEIVVEPLVEPRPERPDR